MLTLNSTRFSQWNLQIHFFPQPYHWRGLWNIPSYRCCGKHYCITWVAEISRTDAHDRWLADVFQCRESCATSSRSPPKQRRTLIVTVTHFQKCSVTCQIDKTWEPNQQQFFFIWKKKMKQWSQRKTVDLNNIFLFPCDTVPRFVEKLISLFDLSIKKFSFKTKEWCLVGGEVKCVNLVYQRSW